MDLKERIEKSKKALYNYPEWAVKNAYFQGGGRKRSDEPLDFKSYGNY